MVCGVGFEFFLQNYELGFAVNEWWGLFFKFFCGWLVMWWLWFGFLLIGGGLLQRCSVAVGFCGG